jgi:hypothetical protein
MEQLALALTKTLYNAKREEGAVSRVNLLARLTQKKPATTNIP